MSYYTDTMLDARPTRLVLVALAAVGTLLAVIQWMAYVDNRARVVTEAQVLDLGASDRQQLYRERDDARAQVRLLRQLILHRSADAEQYSRQLQRARQLAEDLAPRLPAAWEVQWALGASTYLEWTLRRDERLIRQPQAWHEPLERSIELAPGTLEPARFLAFAYLELWPMLAADRRQQAEEILRRALLEPALFEALLPAWLERAANRDEAFEVIPDRPENWLRVQEVYAADHQWTAYLEAHARYLEALGRYHDAQLEEAEARREGGDLRRARGQFLNVAIQLQPASPRDDERLQQAITRSPAGANRVPALVDPLDRLLRLALLRPLPVAPSVVLRMAGLTHDLPPHREALAMVVGGELAVAERLEDHAGAELWTATWAPYLIAKANLLLARKQPVAARTALDRVADSWRSRLAYLLTEEHWARAADDVYRLSAVQERLTEFDRTAWPADAWRQQGEVFFLEWQSELQSTDQPTSLTLSFGDVSPAGAVVEVRLDGYILDTVIARSGRRVRLALSAPLAAAEAHLLEVERLAGGGWQPGTLQLRGQRQAKPHRRPPADGRPLRPRTE